MHILLSTYRLLRVALLAEGVDRNDNTKSLQNVLGVALLAEGVDRNMSLLGTFGPAISRPPRGGRG